MGKWRFDDWPDGSMSPVREEGAGAGGARLRVWGMRFIVRRHALDLEYQLYDIISHNV